MPKNRHVPERSCVVCRIKLPKVQLVRVIRTAQGSAAVDVTGTAPGKGAYLCRTLSCWERAVGTAALGRSFGHDISAQNLEQVRTYYQQTIIQQATAN